MYYSKIKILGHIIKLKDEGIMGIRVSSFDPDYKYIKSSKQYSLKITAYDNNTSFSKFLRVFIYSKHDTFYINIDTLHVYSTEIYMCHDSNPFASIKILISL